MPLVYFICTGKIFKRHFQVFTDDFPEKPFREVLPAMDWHGSIPAIIGLHPDARSPLANE